MNYEALDPDIMEAKVDSKPSVFILNESHVQKHCHDIGFKDPKHDLIPEIYLRITLADVVILHFENQTHILKQKGINLFQF